MINQVNLTSRSGCSSKSSCVFSESAKCLFEAGKNSSNIAILPRSQIKHYDSLRESQMEVLGMELHKGFKSHLNSSISCLEIMKLPNQEELLFVGGKQALEVYNFSRGNELKRIHIVKEEAFSLRALSEGVLIIGRGFKEKKILKGRSALVLMVPGTKLNPGENFVQKKTKTSFLCTFGTSLTGLLNNHSELIILGVHNQKRNCVAAENLHTGKCFSFKAHTILVYSLAVDWESRWVVSGGWDKSVALWKPTNPLEDMDLMGQIAQEKELFFRESKRMDGLHKSWVNHLQIFRDGEGPSNAFVLSGGFDHQVKILSLQRLEILYEFDFKAKVFNCCVYKKDIWVVGEDPDRLQLITPINLKKKKVITLKNHLRNFLGNQLLDSKIRKTEQDKLTAEEMKTRQEFLKYQNLLEESESTITEIEDEKIKLKKDRMKLFDKLKEKEQKRKKLKVENVTLSEKNKKLINTLKDIDKILESSKIDFKIPESLFLNIKEKIDKVIIIDKIKIQDNSNLIKK